MTPLPRFQEKKATQAAAKFLKLAGGTMNYTLLIKFLYLLDRTALKEYGRLVTYDCFYEMKLGPVLSHVYNLITEPSLPEEHHFWPNFISPPKDFSVDLLEDPGDSELSEAEEEIIERIFARFGHYRQSSRCPFNFVNYLHKKLPELKGVTEGREEITISDILKAVHKSPDEIRAIESDLHSLAFRDKVLASD